MIWSPDLFGKLTPSPDLLRKKKVGGDAPPAHQLDLLEGFCLTISGSGAVAPSIQVPAWIEGVCKAMNPDTNDLLTRDTLGARWSTVLRRRFPKKTAKEIGAELGHDWRTVQSWLAGQAPNLAVPFNMALQRKDPLILFELAGMTPPSAVVVDGELAALCSDLDALGERIARLKTGGG